jgi:xylose isomerase
MRIPPKVRLEFTSIEIITYLEEVCDRVDINALNQAQTSQDALAAQSVIWDAIMQEKRFTR